MKDNINKELPLGFGMALAQNEKAMTRFSSMTEEEKQNVIAKTSDIKSKKEMQSFVRSLY